jgi:hypothetical protein
MRKLASVGLLFVMAFSMATGRAETPPGFQTGSCEYPAGHPLPGEGSVLEVPDDYATVQEAVNAAAEGDTVRIKPATTPDGEYHEAVVVRTPGLRIQGTDRNLVSFDGDGKKEYAFYVLADRVLIENMTGHNYVETAFYWGKSRYGDNGSPVAGVTGYWGRYLTAYNNGQYGIYAFDARCGQIDHSYASGNADSGFYIGECFPCDGVITDVLAENNAIGYSGTNAGGNLSIRDSVWRNNAMGIVPNSLNGEARPPQHGAMFEHNIVDSNNNKTAPGSGIAGLFYGSGIVIAGGNRNQVFGNTVTDHALAGIVLAPLPDPDPTDPSKPLAFIPSGNIVWGNTVWSTKWETDLSFDLAQGLLSGPANCWADNVGKDGKPIEATRTAPLAIETLFSCSQVLNAPGGDPRVELGLLEGVAGVNGRAPSDWNTYGHIPAPQTSMDSNDLVNNLAKWLPALGLTD